MPSTLTIYLADTDNVQFVLPRIAKMISEGYISGSSPTWNLAEDEEAEEAI